MNKLKKIPKFKNQDQEREFWSKHNSTDYLDWSKAAIFSNLKPSTQQINELLTRGVEQVFVRAHIEKSLKAGNKLRIKLGIDPTGPKIHIGRAIQLWKLRDFQELGHQIVLIIGDFTTLIGDASDKQSKRPILTQEQVQENMKDYLPQIGKILDLTKTEVHYNSQWLGKLSALDLLKLSMHFTAQQMIQRRNFKERWDANKEIGLHELDYPLLQGYDSVAVKADLELGGSDQLFNLKVGREIQKMFNQKPQDIMTTQMLIGLDGRKMSTSWGNVINILDEPNEMYGKVMSMRDNAILEYFEIVSRLPQDEIREILKQSPRNAKARLAREIVSIYHGKNDAIAAEKEFEQIFKDKGKPSKMPRFKPSKSTYLISDLLAQAKLATSKAEAKRLIEQGGVKINDKIINDWQTPIKIRAGMILQVGKRRFMEITV